VGDKYASPLQILGDSFPDPLIYAHDYTVKCKTIVLLHVNFAILLHFNLVYFLSVIFCVDNYGNWQIPEIRVFNFTILVKMQKFDARVQ